MHQRVSTASTNYYDYIEVVQYAHSSHAWSHLEASFGITVLLRRPLLTFYFYARSYCTTMLSRRPQAEETSAANEACVLGDVFTMPS